MRFLNGYPKAADKKNVTVIGAGPAGLEAAYRLGMRIFRSRDLLIATRRFDSVITMAELFR